MNLAVGVALIDLLLIGPVVSRVIEEHIELFFLAIGLLAMTLAGHGDGTSRFTPPRCRWGSR